MPNLTVVGGVYRERCIRPLWDDVYGSAGRAVAAIAKHVEGKTTLASYVASDLNQQALLLAAVAEAVLQATTVSMSVSFDYLHPLATPSIRPSPSSVEKHLPIHVTDEVVLRFGMLEGSAIVDAPIAIYDPQSAFEPEAFGANGSKADRLAVVLNRFEASSITGADDPHEAAKRLRHDHGTEVVVVKMDGHGSLVVTPDGETTIPVYQTNRVWKIGSGDVFTATFALAWGCEGLGAAEAADLASRATASYCDSRTLPIPAPDDLRQLKLAPVVPGSGMVYLASPFFDLGQRWLVEESRSMLLVAGARVFSPVHDVGPGPGEIVAPEDLRGLDRSDVVFAILNGLDPGTIFEVGYAVKRGIPVVCLAENLKDEDLKMISGTGCAVTDDFTTAIYSTIWRLPKA